MRSEADSVLEYLESLPDDRAEAIESVRDVILRSIDDGFDEVMRWGMISYEVPLETNPDTYNGKPLLYAALGSQKNHMAIYLTGVYATPELREQFIAAYEATGKKLDMGQSCVRFRTLESVPLEVIGDAIAAYDVESFVELVNSVRSNGR